MLEVSFNTPVSIHGGEEGGGKAVNGRKLERCVSETLIGVMEYVVVRWVHNRTQEVFLSCVNMRHPASDR